MHGQPRRARLRYAVPNRNGQLDRLVPPLPKVLTPCPPLTAVLTPCPPLPPGAGGRGGGRRCDETERQVGPTRPNRFHHLRDERAAEHGDFGLRVALERVERECHAHAFAVPEKRALGRR